jgi:hypothetical protein
MEPSGDIAIVDGLGIEADVPTPSEYEYPPFPANVVT